MKKPPASVVTNVDKDWSPIWKEYGTVDGTFYAAPEQRQREVAGLVLAEDVRGQRLDRPDHVGRADDADRDDRASGKVDKPWCAGIESGDATGWPATDWLEDVMLRTAGPDVYDQWVTHEIPFNDPQVATALDEVGKILKNPTTSTAASAT